MMRLPSIRQAVFGLVLFTAQGWAGCSPEETPATQIVVEVQSDLAPGSELQKVQIELRKPDGSEDGSTVLPEIFVDDGSASADGTKALPLSFSITKGREARIMIRVVGISPADANHETHQVEQRAIVAFKTGKTQRVEMFLTAACWDQSCLEDPAATCYPRGLASVAAGQCGPIDALSDQQTKVVDPSQLKPAAPPTSTVDAGTEADAEEPVETQDAGADARTNRSSEDAQVSDGALGPDAASGPAAVCSGAGCDPCANHPCEHSGSCTKDGPVATCTCLPGYLGATCALDACKADPCLHNGVCQRITAGRLCECAAPWHGVSCERNDDTALSGLEVTAGKLWPPFDPDVTAYSVDLGFEDPSIALRPTARVPEGAVLRVEGTSLASGALSAPKQLALNASDGFTIEVSSNTGARQTYTVTVRRSLVQRAYVKLDASAGSNLGSALAMDDTRIAYGIPATAITDIPHAGAVQLLRIARGTLTSGQFLRAPGTPAEGLFGSAIALSGDTIAVTSPGESVGETAKAGAVYVFTADGVGWFGSPQRLIAPVVAEARTYGSMLALRGDVLAVADREGSHVHVYRRGGSRWNFEQTLGSPDQLYFGLSVSTDGTFLAVGTEDSGTHLYRYDATKHSWQLHATLTPERTDERLFGMSSTFRDGSLWIGSGYACLFGCNGYPALYAYRLEGDAWVRSARAEGPFPPAIPDAARPSFFAASLVSTGQVIATVAPLENLGVPGIFSAIPSDTSMQRASSGAVYLYRQSGSQLSLDGYLKPSNAGAGDSFGTSLAAGAGLLVVGAPYEDGSATTILGNVTDDDAAADAGAVYVFGPDCTLLPKGAVIPGC